MLVFDIVYTPTCCSNIVPAPPVANGLGMIPRSVILGASEMTALCS